MVICQLILILCLFYDSTYAEIQEGTVSLIDSKGFGFLGKFMLTYNKGNDTEGSWMLDRYRVGEVDVYLHLKGVKVDVSTKYELAMYDDQDESWPLMRKHPNNKCYNNSQGKMVLNTNFTREHEIFRFRETQQNDTWFRTVKIHEHVRPRWWWIYLVKCDYDDVPVGDFDGHDIRFTLHWKQNLWQWSRELSTNEQYQNTFHMFTPFVCLSLLTVQCISWYLYKTKIYPNVSGGYVHIIIKLITILLLLQFISQIFQMIYWLHLTYNGVKEFSILMFAFLFEISSGVIFLFFLFTIFALGWRMSVSTLNTNTYRALLFFCMVVELLDFCIYVWSEQYYGNDETTLYKYSEDPQVVYGVMMLMIGIVFYAILLFNSIKDSLNGIITSVQRNFRILIGFILFFCWFLWPIIAVGATDTFGNSRSDFGCDVITFVMRYVSFLVVIMITNPINPYYGRWFDFGKQFVHARYIKNKDLDFIGDDSDDSDSDDDNKRSSVQMNVIKIKKKKKKKKKKKSNKQQLKEKLTKIADNSDDDIDINISESDTDSDDNNRNMVSAISIKAAKRSNNDGAGAQTQDNQYPTPR